MKRIVSFVAVLLALAIAAPASAQVQTGSILVRAIDEQGAMMPGVTVTISSPVLVAGSMTGVTDAGGVYRFPSLVPGTYAIKMELAGFQTVNRENIIVLVGQTTPVEFAMKVASVAENVTVTGASPTVDTTSANVAVNLSAELIQGTPGGRDIWGLLEAKVPGLVMSRPDVGGTSGGLQGVFSARGTTSAQNTSFLNGVNVGDPAAIGAAGFYYDVGAFDDIQVSTGAHDITVPTSGVFLNMITKTGGNKWNGSSTVTWTGDKLQGRNDTDPTLQKYGFRPNSNTSDFVSDINFGAGGPLVQNKLRFFGSFRDWRVHTNVPVQLSQVVLDQTNITSGLGNVTWQANQNNRINGFYSRQRYSKPNRLLNNASVTVIDSTSDEEDMFDLAQGLWNSVLGKNFFIDARLGLNKILFPTYQNGGNQQSTTDKATGIVYGNFPTDTIRNRDRFQANTTGQYYVDQALGGRHEIKFGFDYSHAVTKNQNRRVDDVTTTYTSASGDVRAAERESVRHAAKRCDRAERPRAVRPGQLQRQAADRHRRPAIRAARGLPAGAVEPGLAVRRGEHRRLRGPAAQLRRDPRRREVEHRGAACQRGLRRHRRRQDGREGVGRPLLLRAVDRRRRREQRQPQRLLQRKLHAGTMRNGDHRFQIGEQTGTPVVSAVVVNGAILTSIDPNFSRPYTDEYSFGVDRELMANVKLSAVYTYRREKNLQATRNPAENVYATTPTSAVDPGIDGVVGTADDGTYNFFQRISAANPSLITNDPNVVQSYKGLEITLTKRLSNRWQMLAGYTFSKNRLDNVSVDVSPNFLINANGNDHGGGQRRPAESVQAHGDVPPAVPRRDRQRQLPVAAGAAGHASDQPRPRGRRGPDDQPRAARQHAYRHADHDRPPGRQAVQASATGASRPRWTSTTWPTPIRRLAFAR